LAYIHLNYDWNWEAALSEYNKAIQYGLHDPDHFITFYDIFINKDFEHAIHISEQIVERDPLDMQNHWHVGICNLYAGRWEEALASFNNAIELDPNYSEGHRWKGLTLGFMGKYEEAIYSIKKALEITQGEGPANFDLLMVKALMGNKEELMQILSDWEKSGAYMEPSIPAVLNALMEMPDDVIFWLEKGYQERSSVMISLKSVGFWDPYRNDPRFIEIYDKMNFPE